LKILSKSRFISGIQCEKKLYFDVHRKELKPPLTEQQETLFATGSEIGLLAQLYFSGGFDASPESYLDFSKSIADTKSWIETGIATIYEAAFSQEGIMSAVDILHHENGKRWAIEVKSSTSVKAYHLTDASLQYWVMQKSGFAPDKFILMHINNKYVKNGEINPKELFTLQDITEQVVNKQSWVTENIDRLKNMLKIKEEPSIEIGKHCDSPFDCGYKHHCWKHIPEKSVFSLYSPRGKEWKLYESGILMLSDIPESTILNHRQELQINGIKDGASYIDQTAIDVFLSDWQFPLYFFDFETIFPTIPVLDGTRPFQQVPFQYSLHIVSKINEEPIHKEFLAHPEDFSNKNSVDPRKQLIEQLKKDIGSTGSIVAYNATFEISILKNLAVAFPEEKVFIDQLIDRFVDLLIPFRKAWYYLPKMGGSASIKSVLPAIAPNFNYSDLEISNGGDASNIFLSMIKNQSTREEKLTRRNLKEYCKRDTYGMIVLWQELNQTRKA
jgi:hypothetical protein